MFRFASIFTLVLIIALSPAISAHADAITIGKAKFDFDAPLAPLTVQQTSFFVQYKDAVNKHDEAALLALADNSWKSCKIDGRRLLSSDLLHVIPDDAKVRFFPAATDFAREMGLGDMASLAAQPTAVLGISWLRTVSPGSTKKEAGMILRPVRQVGDSYTLVPYCLTEKGKERLDQKEKAQHTQLKF